LLWSELIFARHLIEPDWYCHPEHRLLAYNACVEAAFDESYIFNGPESFFVSIHPIQLDQIANLLVAPWWEKAKRLDKYFKSPYPEYKLEPVDGVQEGYRDNYRSSGNLLSLFDDEIEPFGLSACSDPNSCPIPEPRRSDFSTRTPQKSCPNPQGHNITTDFVGHPNYTLPGYDPKPEKPVKPPLPDVSQNDESSDNSG